MCRKSTHLHWENNLKVRITKHKSFSGYENAASHKPTILTVKQLA